jgi:hypothetical protein
VSGFGYYRKPRPDYSLQLIPLTEMIARIEALRLEEAPDTCPTCGTASKPLSYHRCARCGLTKPLGQFGVDRRWNSPRSHCRDCERLRHKGIRTRHALCAVRRSA